MDVAEFVGGVEGFVAMSHADKVKQLGWFIHAVRGKPSFRVGDIRDLYETLHLDQPGNLRRCLEALAEKRPPELLVDGGAFRLHAATRAALDTKLGKSGSTLIVEKTLAELPGRLFDETERVFLEETLVCYRHRAFRAAIVMAWNLAFDHLARWILADASRLQTFNQILAQRFPKKGVIITERASFENLYEWEVVEVAGGLAGITSNMKKKLKEKLERRNMYAHPSTVEVGQPNVDDMIYDLVTNIVLTLR